MHKEIPWWNPVIGEQEHALIKKVLESNFPNEGKLTIEFEKKIATLLGSKFAVACTSGTAAIFLALKGMGIGHGDEVIVPDMTFIATANAAAMTGATPVLVDVDPHTLNMSPDAFSRAITQRTKAVVPVHVTGRGADLKRIMEIANQHQIITIEDAAQAFLSKHKGKFLGTIGKAGCFSFSPNKTITTGQGGAIVTDDEELYFRLIELKDQGRPMRGTGGDDKHLSIGYNFKLTDMQAALGLGQLSYAHDRIARMTQIQRIYKEELEGVKGIDLYPFDLASGEVPLWSDAIAHRRNELVAHLESHKMGCRKYWYPLHTQKPYHLADTNFAHSSALSPKSLWLPSAFTLSDDDVFSVCKEIKRFYSTS